MESLTTDWFSLIKLLKLLKLLKLERDLSRTRYLNCLLFPTQTHSLVRNCPLANTTLSIQLQLLRSHVSIAAKIIHLKDLFVPTLIAIIQET
jgi:hypothetical protein